MTMNCDGTGEIDWFTKELDYCKATFQQGNLAALIDALWLCDEMPAVTPHWVPAASRKK
jgi:hypothetical protein